VTDGEEVGYVKTGVSGSVYDTSGGTNVLALSLDIWGGDDSASVLPRFIDGCACGPRHDLRRRRDLSV
jgi:hypothetical protein